MKRTIALFLTCVMLCCAMTLPSFAAIGNGASVMPLWDNISTITLDISFDGTEGNATGAMRKQDSGVTLSEGTVTVYKYENGDWVYVSEAYNSTTRYTLAVSCDFTCESGVEYMAVFDTTAYRGDVGESATHDCYRTCP